MWQYYGAGRSVRGCLRLGNLRDELAESGGTQVDLLARRVDLGKEHAAELGVVIVEVAGERLTQRRARRARPTEREFGEDHPVALFFDQRLEHRPAGLSEQIGGNGEELDQVEKNKEA